MAAGIFRRLDTVIIRVRDYRQAQAWYEAKLGLQTVYTDPEQRLVVLSAEPASITLWELRPDETPARGAGTYPIFFADDLLQTHALLRERGVAVEAVQGTSAAGWFTFRDPDGNHLEVCHFD